MNNQLHKIISSILPVFLFSLVFLASCGTENDPELGNLEVRLYDAPLDSADEVNISVRQVQINQTSDEESGWTVINTPDQTYNLLELTNGAFEVLGDTALAPGTYQQIRLVLNETGNNIVVDGQVYDLEVPSGAESGLKLNVNTEIEAGVEYVLLLDFDAARSVVEAGNEQSGVRYLLRPVIRANNQAQTGNIAGTVDPAESEPIIYAIQNSDTLASSIADTVSGEFRLIGLAEGSYTVSVDPRTDGYEITDTTGVEVTVGETSELGTIVVDEEGVL